MGKKAKQRKQKVGTAKAPTTPDEAVHRIAAKYNAGGTPHHLPLKETAPGKYEQDFGSVGAIVERIAKKRQARDDREGIVG